MIEIDFDKALLSPEHETEQAKLVNEYFESFDEDDEDDEDGVSELEEYVYSHGSPGLVKALKEREIYCAELKKKGIIVN